MNRNEFQNGFLKKKMVCNTHDTIFTQIRIIYVNWNYALKNIYPFLIK